jgi:hypothetical protein
VQLSSVPSDDTARGNGRRGRLHPYYAAKSRTQNNRNLTETIAVGFNAVYKLITPIPIQGAAVGGEAEAPMKVAGEGGDTYSYRFDGACGFGGAYGFGGACGATDARRCRSAGRRLVGYRLAGPDRLDPRPARD